MNHRYWMKKALELAQKAQASGEVPVGAVVLNPEGQLLGSGYNQVIQQHDCTAHAEILALRQASQRLKNYRLTDCTLLVSLEPCPMCAAALLHARIKHLVFACRDLKSGAAGSVLNLMNGAPFNHRVLVDEGILADESQALLQRFFAQRRRPLMRDRQDNPQ
ncbi:MAG: tRNA adenosine(34) deaminase TadA [Legionellaceae bacterium]|nr:tRNA adenosine(34) deaminase TadA [Legionellaceae bacterium]